jgi:hypothetical protein
MSNLTQRDNNQIERHEHDESIDAKRVYIVGGGDIKVSADTSQIAMSVASAVKEGLAELVPVMKLESPQKQEIVVIKEPQLVEIEKQVIVTEKEFVYIDKPVIIEKIIYKEIEKPILIKEGVQEKSSTNLTPALVALVVLQTLITLGIIAIKL